MKNSSLFTVMTVVIGLLCSLLMAEISTAQISNGTTVSGCENPANASSEYCKEVIAKMKKDTLKEDESECKTAKNDYENAKGNYPPPALLKNARACMEDEEEAGEDAVESNSGDDDEVSARDKDSCGRFVNVSCKALNSDPRDAKEERDDSRKRTEDAEENVNDLKTEVSELEQERDEEKQRIEKEAEQAVIDYQRGTQEFDQFLEDQTAKIDESLEKVKEEANAKFTEMDEAYLKMRTDFRQAGNAKLLSIDSVEMECNKRAEEEEKAVRAKIEAIIANEYTKPRNVDLQSLTSSNKRVRDKAKKKTKAQYNKTYSRCLKLSQKKLEAIENNEKNQIAFLNDQAALIEKKRSDIINLLNKRSESADKEKQKLQERLKQKAKNAYEDFEKALKDKDKELQNLITKYDRKINDKNNKLSTAYQKQMQAQMDLASAATRYNCAEKYGLDSRRANKDMDRYEKAYESLQKYRSTCSSYKHRCNISTENLCELDGKVTDSGPLRDGTEESLREPGKPATGSGTAK